MLIAKANENIQTLSGQDITVQSDDIAYRYYRKQWHDCPATFTVLPFPLFLDLEATSVCNLKCPFCVQTHSEFQKGFMKWELYKKAIDEAAANGCFGVKYHTIGRGEPLLHKQLPEMIAYAKKKKMIDVYTNTNATLLTEELSKKLLGAGLDRISFSIDGCDRGYYESKRVGASYLEVMRNVARFWVLRNTGYYQTKIRIQTVEFPDLDLEKYALAWNPVCDEVSVLRYKSMVSRVFGLKDRDWACSQLWQRMSVLFDGTILPCNHLDRPEYFNFGNVKRNSLAEVWQGRMAESMRQEHKAGRSHMVGACDGCHLRSSEILARKENEQM